MAGRKAFIERLGTPAAFTKTLGSRGVAPFTPPWLIAHLRRHLSTWRPSRPERRVS